MMPQAKLPALTPDEKKVITERCLMITDTHVVDGPRATGLGPWSFGRLMTEIANKPATGIEPKQMVEDWLDMVRGDFKRTADAAWDKLSRGKRTLEALPFRLLAIVNRIDLRKNLVLGGTGAGELRFVYGLHDADGNPFDGTVIFEFGVKRTSFNETLAWAREWYQLRNLDIKGSEFNAALQQITDQCTLAGADAEALPNRSALSQLRVSSGGRNQKLWSFFEFRVDVQNSGQLVKVRTKQTPELGYDGQKIIGDYLRANRDAILGDRHQVPPFFQGEKFLAEVSLLPNQRPPKFFWKGEKLPDDLLEARHRFSLNTCSACHARETKTDFFQVRNRKKGEAAALSGFLIGITVEDPAGQKDEEHPADVKTRTFNDLAKRVGDLRALVELGQPYETRRVPLNAVH